jgi:hypothetical protein
MSSSSNLAVTSFSLFPTSTAAPCAFGLFGQDPRETHAKYEELAALVMARPSHGRTASPKVTRRRRSSGNSLVVSLRRIFGGL